jgi:hypothetical protein
VYIFGLDYILRGFEKLSARLQKYVEFSKRNHDLLTEEIEGLREKRAQIGVDIGRAVQIQSNIKALLGK